MKRSVVSALLVLAAVAVQVSVANAQPREEIRLTTIIPDQSILRAKKGIVSVANYKPSVFSDDSIPADTLIIDGKVGIGTASPKTALDVNGLIRTARYSLIGAPAPSADNKGAIFYNTDDNKMYYSNGSAWQPMGGGELGNFVDVTSVASTETVQGPVSTDGILTVGSKGETSGIQIYVGNSPTSLFVITHENSHGAVSLTAPVKKGYYWKTVIGSGSFEKVYWVSCGS